MSDIGDRIRALAQHTPAGERILPPAHDLEALAARADDLSARLAEAEARAKAWDEQLAALTEDLGRVHRMLDGAEAERDYWAGEYTDVSERYDAATAERDKARAQRDEFKGRYGDMWDERDAARAERDAALAKLERVEAILRTSYGAQLAPIRAALADDTAQEGTDA